MLGRMGLKYNVRRNEPGKKSGFHIPAFPIYLLSRVRKGRVHSQKSAQYVGDRCKRRCPPRKPSRAVCAPLHREHAKEQRGMHEGRDDKQKQVEGEQDKKQ